MLCRSSSNHKPEDLSLTLVIFSSKVILNTYFLKVVFQYMIQINTRCISNKIIPVREYSRVVHGGRPGKFTSNLRIALIALLLRSM